MGLKRFSLGLGVGFLLAGCASFSYRHYGLNASSYEGLLLGPTPAQDLDFTVCTPTETNKSPCVVMLADEYFKFKEDYLITQQALKDCQAPH